MADARLDGVFAETRRNAAIGWIVLLGLAGLAMVRAVEGSYRWTVFTGLAIAIVLAPAVAFRDPLAVPPWELLVLVAVPVVDATLLGGTALTGVAVYVAVAAVALVVAVEIHAYTSARMTHWFAVALVVIATLAVAAVWNVGQWTVDVLFGTSLLDGGDDPEAANYALMIDFIYAAIAGLVAGIGFDWYLRRESSTSTLTSEPTEARSGRPGELETKPEPEPVPSLVGGRLGVPDRAVRLLSRGMQVALVGVLAYGVAARDMPTVANASIALAITFLPALLERNASLPLEPELVCWITAAVFLHALGTAGLYDALGGFDHLTHALSASVVAAGGYAVVRAIDLHTDSVYLPYPMMAGFILLFVLAFGVLWEIAEFAIDQGAQTIGIDAVLAQHGITDTIVDLVFDVVGAVVTAVAGTVYLTDVSHRIAESFEG